MGEADMRVQSNLLRKDISVEQNEVQFGHDA